MKRNTKRVFKNFDYLHTDDFAAYLSAMSRKGWHFRQWGVGLTFQRGEPAEITYAVEIFPDASEYDTRPAVNTEEFAEYCAAAGWKLLDAKRKFCIFRQIREDAEEILTDAERLENVAKEEGKILRRQLILALWMCILQNGNFFGNSFANYIFSNDLLFLLLLVDVLTIGALAREIVFLLWKKKQLNRIAQGKRVSFGKAAGGGTVFYDAYSWIPMMIAGCYIVFCAATARYDQLLLIAMILIPLILMSWLIARFRPDAVTNQVIQIIVPCLVLILALVIEMGITLTKGEKPVSMVDVPLLYEDIGGDAGKLEDITLDGSTSIFGSGLRCGLRYEEKSFNYQVYRSDYPWVLDRICDNEQKAYHQNGTDVTDIWNAEVAVRYENGQYLIRYPEGVVLVSVAKDTVFSQEQTEIIRSALLESR